MTFPILFVQYVFEAESVFQSTFVKSVLFSSLLEEFFKWIVLLVAIFRHIDFEDPYDGILYGASLSLGFATVENILYLLEYGLGAAFLRAFLPVSSHALFGVVMGYYFGKAKFSNKKESKWWLGMALIAAATLHIAYNASLYAYDNLLYGAVPFMLFLWWFGLSKVRQAHRLSVDHYHKHTPE